MTTSAPNQAASPVSGNPRLLESVLATRASVGDGLNDFEFSCLLRQSALPDTAGFGFLGFFDGVVSFTVPPQDPASWYLENGWIRPDKEQVARAIGAKHGLALYEPPDEDRSILFPRPQPPAEHHHLELTNPLGTVVVAHPRYLKIRLLASAPNAVHLWKVRRPLDLGSDLLDDLSALYPL